MKNKPIKNLPRLNIRHASTVLSKTLNTLGVAVRYFPGYVHRKLHLHGTDIVLLSFILRGNGKHYLGDNVYDEKPGYLSVTHYGQYHDIITGPGGMDVMNVYLDLERHPLPSLPSELQPILPEILPMHPCLQNKLNSMTRLFIKDHMTVARNLFAIESEIQNGKKGFQAAVRNYFSNFLIDCCRNAIENGMLPDPKRPVSGNSGIEAVRKHIDANFAKPHTLESLANFAKLSPEYLCRAFRKYTGKTVFSYLIQRRIQDAMVHLRFTDDKISSIATECGFNDFSYFNRKFKELAGKPPREYRKFI
ncbi:MAG: AraC family transcriptional regulator [Lentisphaerota bacterium]